MSAMPDDLELAVRLEQQGNRRDAEVCYRRLVASRPELAVARFNFACFLRRGGQLEEALAEHQKALDLGIDEPEEVLSNMGVISNELRRDERAREFFESAIAANPRYIPAMYNLALLHEEFGDKQQALRLFGKILDLNPAYHNALVRIAHAQRVVDPADPVIRKLRRSLRRANMDDLTRENLHFALGKTLDDCGSFDEAFAQYELGNRLSAARLAPYDRKAEEARVAAILELFTHGWLAGREPVSDRPLIFITGMFRSGSTLFEQVLAAHPAITSGGEIDYFGRELALSGKSFPVAIAALDAAGWRRLGTGYIEYLDRTFPAGAIVTNKRPDAFEWLGMLKALFPNARFVNTLRDARDTCLSIYFQQLDGRIAYANDLANIGHRYAQYRRLMEHWKRLFGACIFDAVYDDFVADRRAVTGELLRFLGLPWHEGCLEFQQLANRVRTASVWQVREALYSNSSGRWRNYERHLEPALRMLEGVA
jgi:tetratricopeptide (TPR) repeat protein